MIFLVLAPVEAASDDRTISSITMSPDNTFDNRLTAAGSDSGVYLRLNLSGGAAVNDNADAQGGYRYEMYNASDQIVRRRMSYEINSNPTEYVQWNGQGDSNIADTLAYGAYKVRAYASMRNPAVTATIKGSGITIDRPGDLHVTAGGVLTWINAGTSLSFCQVSLGDPTTEAPTFLRLTLLPSGFGSVGTDMAWGVVMNSSNEVFVTDNYNGGVAGCRIGKYSTATETWLTLAWATQATTSASSEDEWAGLGIDSKDSIYLGTGTAFLGGGAAGNREVVVKFRDNGLTATEVATSGDRGDDFNDVAPLWSGDSYVYGLDRTDKQIERFSNDLLTVTTLVDWGAGSPEGGIAVNTSGYVYITDNTVTPSRYMKYSSAGALVYTITDARINNASGICVWEKTATGESFVMVGGRASNSISIYKENTAGDSAVFVREISDDVYALKTPEGVAVNPDSAVYVVNRGSRSVKKFTVDGIFSSLTGAANGLYIMGTDNTSDLTDSSGFKYPRAIAVNTSGEIYVFDQDNVTTPTHLAIKKFSASGVPLGVVCDIDATWPAGIYNGPIIAAVYGNGSIYAISTENGGRVVRFSEAGAVLQHLGNSALADANPVEGNTAADVIGIQVAPFFDRANNVFYPQAVQILTTGERIEVWRPDFSGGAFMANVDVGATSGPVLPALSNVVQTFLVDDGGEFYFIPDLPVTGTYRFRRYNAATSEYAGGAYGLLEAQYASGSGASALNGPRQAIWTDNQGVFKNNPVSGLYERKMWVVDQANDRLQQFTVAWNSVVEEPITIAISQDTPLVVSAALSGDTVISIGGQYFAGVTTCSMQINFNKAMFTTAAPDTMVVQFKPNGGVFTGITRNSYASATWKGTFNITGAMADGEAIIKVGDAYDADGSVHFIDPNPDQTDFDLGDDFLPFVIDKTPPIYTLTTPSSGGDSTSLATYIVAGQVTSDATGLDATVLITNWSQATGGTAFDSKTLSANAGDGSFSTSLNLRSPAPTDNFFEVAVIDKLGNRTTLTPRRLVQREKNVGTAYIDPSSEIQVNTLGRYNLVYTAAQTLTSETLQITVPTAWSAPQTTNGATNGYLTVTPSAAYTESTIASQVITLRGVNRAIGEKVTLVYGDSVISSTGRAKSTLDAPLDNPSNTFQVLLMQAGETSYTGVSSEAGKSLTVPLRDSAMAVSMLETGPGSPSVMIAKSEETKVLTVRFSNSNTGNHTNRVTQVVLSVESQSSGSLNWNAVASRVVAKNTGEGITFADVTTMPAGQALTFSPTNLTATQGATRDMEIWVTMSPTATADTARFFFTNASAFTAVDDVSGKTLTVVEQGVGVTDRKTGLYDIYGQTPADTLMIGADTSLSASPFDVATGQEDVGVMDLVFRNDPPHVDTPVNTVRIDKIVLSIRNEAGTGIVPSRVLRGIQLRNPAGSVTYGGLDTPNVPNVGDTVSITLSGLSIASGAEALVRVFVDIVNDTTTNSKFRVRVVDTNAFTAKDQTTQATVRRLDDPTRIESFPFQTDTITILRRAGGTLVAVQPLQTDSTSIKGELGDNIIVGTQFFVALSYTATAGRSALRVIPSDTDLKIFIGGTNRTGEFTIGTPAAKTIAAGAQDTFFYSLVQNLGTSVGVMTVTVADSGGPDTRPRLFDAHDYTDPDVLRATLTMPTPSDTVTVAASSFDATAFSLDTTYAGAGETAVAIVRFQIVNNLGSARQVDSVVVEAINAGAKVTQVRLYHDNKNGVLNPSTDTLVATGTLSAGETVLLTLSPKVTLAASSGTETFFVAFAFDTTLTDGDTFDARIPASGIRVIGESPFPGSLLNSSGNGVVEVVASRVTVTPDTQVVAVAATPSVTLKALDAYGNLDNLTNVRSATQGRNVQVQFTLTDADADTSARVTATAGMTDVTPSPGPGVRSINAKLASGQGVVTITDTEAETVAISVTSVLTTGTGAVGFATMISASAQALTATDSGRPDSRAVTVLSFLVSNQSGAGDQVTRVGIRSLNSVDTNVAAVMLFKDANGNGRIDSGTDVLLGTGNFASGFADFNFLTVDVYDQDSILLMVGYNIGTSVTDANVIDCVADTVTIQSSGQNLASSLNSTPDLRIDVQARALRFTPTTGSAGTGSNLTIAVAAADTYGNVDKDYTGGATKCYFDLSLSAQFNSALTTLTNKEHPVSGDYTQIKGNLVQGRADLVFSDGTAENPVLSVLAAVGLPGPNDTGGYTFTQGLTATALDLTSLGVEPGDTNRVLLRFRVSAVSTSDSVTQVKVQWRGPRTADVTNLRLYRDVDANEAFSATADTLFGVAGSFTAETVTFTDTRYIANGTSLTFFFVADVAGTAVGGDTLDARLQISSISTQGGISNVPSSVQNSVGVETVARVPDTLAVGGTMLSNRNASEDQEEIIPMTISFSSPVSADRKFTIEKLMLRVNGPLGGRVPSGVIATASIRHISGSPTYVTKSSVESSGDSMTFDIAFDSNLAVGGLTPETLTVQVVLKIAASVTHGETFYLSLVGLDSAWIRAFDHPTGASTPSSQRSNVIVLAPSATPILSGVIILRKKALVTQTAIRITDLSDVDVDTQSLGIGEQFKVHLGLAATAGRADAQVRSADTDLTFLRAGGTVDITSEFVMVSRTHMTMTDLAAGSSDTIVYTIVQGNPLFSGGGESLVINNLLSPDTAPYMIDKNSAADAVKLRIHALENAGSSDSVMLDTAGVTVLALALSDNNIAPDSRGVRVMALRMTDVAGPDTLTAMAAHLLTPAAASMIKSCWVALDVNKNGVFDTGVDPTFGAASNFKSSDTVYFTGSRAMAGASDTLEVYLVIDMETGPVTDSTWIKVEVPINCLGIEGKDSVPKTVLTSAGYFKTRVVATRLVVTPKTQSVSAGSSAAFSIRAEDNFGNLNVVTTDYAQATVTARINDTWVPATDKSARWTSTVFLAGTQAPAALPSAVYYDSVVSGKLSGGVATTTMLDTQAETVSVSFTASGISGETVIAVFTAEPSVAAVTLSNLMKILPDSTNARILVIDVAYPATSTVIDSILVKSENTADTSMTLVRLWADLDGDGVLNTATDTNIDTGTWSGGSVLFLSGGKSYTKISGIPTVRFFVTAQMAVSPLLDHDSIGARIDVNGLRMSPGGFFPTVGELDSISSDTQNAVIDIDATRSGGVIRLVHPGGQNLNEPFSVTVRAEDQYGNMDRVFTTLGSSAGKNVTFSASPASFTFNSATMTEVSGWPGATPVARFKTGVDMINITPTLADTITLTASLATNPPADTSITIVVGKITADSLAVPSDSVQPGAINVRTGRFYVANEKFVDDYVDTITVLNDGDHPDTGLTVRIVIDVDKNGVFDSGVDLAFGTAGSFVNGSFARYAPTVVPAENSAHFLVLFNLSTIWTIDSRILRISVDTGEIKMSSGASAAGRVLRSSGRVQTYVIPSSDPAFFDSISISAGNGIANSYDTVVVQVSVIDTGGTPARGRSVQLTGDVGAPITVVSANPQTTGADGMVRFVIRTGTAGSYNYSATIDGAACGKTAVAIFIDENLASGTNLGGNPTTNVQQSVLTGLTTEKYFMGNVAFQADNTLVYVRADGTNWELVKQSLGGGVTPLLQMNKAPLSETGQINFLSSVQVETTNTALGNKAQVLAGIITRASGRRAQIYAVDLDFPYDSTRLTPNNPADTNNVPFVNIAWRWFDMNPDGERIITVQDGNLVLFWRDAGNPFNPSTDSANIRYVTVFDVFDSNSYLLQPAPTATNTKIYLAYPSWSPDGTRIALSFIHVSDNLPNGPAVTRSDIYVLKNFGSHTLGAYPNLQLGYPSIRNIKDTSVFVRAVVNDSFAFMPRWTRDGSGLIYTVARGAGWDWQNVFKGYPHTVGTYENGDFATRFVYYDKALETAPYAPIDISNENGAALSSLDVTMAPSGTARLAYIRKSTTGGNQTFEMRTVDLGSEAAVTTQGGVLFDSGRIIAVIPSSDSYASGFRIASARPDSSPVGADSVIITGAAKQFFNPADPTAPVYFADSVTVILYYGPEDFSETELMGYDSDGDQIPDRTEANISAWYWTGANWIEYKAVRYPAENKIEFKTTHFSRYAIGLPMAVRTAAFLGSVHDIAVYPNPWRSDGPTAAYAVTDERFGFKLTNFPDGQVRVRIYTLSGELVADGTLNSPGMGDFSTSPSITYTGIENNGRGTVRWNLQNQAGRRVASGVYLMVLEGPGGRAMRKVAIIR